MIRALLPLLVLLLSLPAHAGKRKPVEVPIDIGIGPAVHLFSGPLAEDQPLHYGLVVSLEAVLDQETLKRFKKQIPKQYRQAVQQMDEVRVSPSVLIPDTLIISPKLENTGMYGISWRPVGLGFPLVSDPVRWDLGVGARLTYAWIQSDGIAGVDGGAPFSMHLLRPGLDARTELEVPFSSRFLVSTGWDSQFYIPQTVGGAVTDVGSLDESVWHVGQGFLKLHFRVPYQVRL